MESTSKLCILYDNFPNDRLLLWVILKFIFMWWKLHLLRCISPLKKEFPLILVIIFFSSSQLSLTGFPYNRYKHAKIHKHSFKRPQFLKEKAVLSKVPWDKVISFHRSKWQAPTCRSRCMLFWRISKPHKVKLFWRRAPLQKIKAKRRKRHSKDWICQGRWVKTFLTPGFGFVSVE